MKEDTPEKVKRPMRCILFSSLLKELNDRLTKLKTDSERRQRERRQRMEKLGWLKGDEFNRLTWDNHARKMVVLEEGEKLMAMFRKFYRRRWVIATPSTHSHVPPDAPHHGGHARWYCCLSSAILFA